MRRISPQTFRNCVAAFLAEATETCNTEYCSVCIQADDTLVSSFLKDTTLAATNDQLRGDFRLSETEFERCLDWVVAHSDMIPHFNDASPYHFGLSRFYRVTWKCTPKKDIALASELVEDYGTMQILGTRFQFGSAPEYYEIKAIVKRIFGINMNDKHVRPKTALG
jgi:hypothetical protein